jgi:hypothetical protein
MQKSVLSWTSACALSVIAAGAIFTSPSRAQTAPHFEAVVNWPKPLPDRWVLGGLGGHCVDAKDHVLILNRQDVMEGDLNAGKLAPPLIEFDPDGNVVNSWGDLKLIDPRLHSCHFDKEGSVWIASAPSGMVQKYTRDGKRLLLQIGTKGKLDSSDGTSKGKPLNSPAAAFFMPSSIFVDRINGDIYVSDGEGAGTNRRVAVFDATGKFLRQWIMEDMLNVHCMAVANDGTVYVCNRRGSGVRIYDKMGNLQRTIAVPWTPVTPPSDGVAKEIGGLGSRYRFFARQGTATAVRPQSEQFPDRNHRTGNRQAPRQLRACRRVPWRVQPSPRHRGGLEGQRLRE